MKKTILKIELSILIALIICGILNINSFSKECDNIRDKMLRMHVIANSDTEEDQKLKLKVRDAVLIAGENIFYGTVTAENAVKMISPEIETLKNAALKVVSEEGYDYDVNVSVEKEYFSARTYNGQVTLPAGYYMAVKVVIGEGNGQNWWCVMFPPMCLPGAETECEISEFLTEKENEIVTMPEKFEFKLKIIEIFDKIFR